MADSGTAGVEASSVFVTAPDGLRLHVRCYGPRLAPSLPVVCLPGLTRTAADFDDLACAFASNPEAPRRVVAREESPGPEESEDEERTTHQAWHGGDSTLTTGYGAFKTGFLLKPANGAGESRPRLQGAEGTG